MAALLQPGQFWQYENSSPDSTRCVWALIFSSIVIMLQELVFLVGRAAIYPDPAAPIFIPPDKFQSSLRAGGGGVLFLSFWGGIEGALFAEMPRAAQAAGLKAA